MNIYIAGSSKAQLRLREVRDSLPPELVSTSGWLDIDYEALQYPVPDDRAKVEAANDMSDLADADVIVLDTIDETTHGGREVELGYAMALGLEVLIVGPKRNIFHQMFETVGTWEEAVERLQEEEW